LTPAVSIQPLNEQALLVQWPSVMDLHTHHAVMRLHAACNQHPFEGFVESVPAYASLTVFYDVWAIRQRQRHAYDFVCQQVNHKLQQATEIQLASSPLIEIPVQYGGPDMEAVAAANRITPADVIDLHTSATYTVWMMGFAPGFAYMGPVHEKLIVSRKETPRVRVPAGSVALAGGQTCVYPFEMPGGWQIIGHTDMKLFDSKRATPSLLQAGQQVKFVAV
jgi:inhibitor of KinA